MLQALYQGLKIEEALPLLCFDYNGEDRQETNVQINLHYTRQ
jgi:hypothetical protein